MKESSLQPCFAYCFVSILGSQIVIVNVFITTLWRLYYPPYSLLIYLADVHIMMGLSPN